VAARRRQGFPSNEKHAWDQTRLFSTSTGSPYAQEMKAQATELCMQWKIPQSGLGRVDTRSRYTKFTNSSHASFDGPGRGALRETDILDNITLYWLMGTAVSSARLYWEKQASRFFAPQGVDHSGCREPLFPDELLTNAPQTWAERAFSKTRPFQQAR